MNSLLATLALILLMPAGPSAQKQESRIYVIARRVDNAPDLGAERKLKEAFRNKKAVVSNVLGEADIVFFVMVEYENYQGGSGVIAGGSGSAVAYSETYIKTAIGFALPVQAWIDHRSDLEVLKENSVWQGDVSAGKLKRASLSKLADSYLKRTEK